MNNHVSNTKGCVKLGEVNSEGDTYSCRQTTMNTNDAENATFYYNCFKGSSKCKHLAGTKIVPVQLSATGVFSCEDPSKGLFYIYGAGKVCNEMNVCVTGCSTAGEEQAAKKASNYVKGLILNTGNRARQYGQQMGHYGRGAINRAQSGMGNAKGHFGGGNRGGSSHGAGLPW